MKVFCDHLVLNGGEEISFCDHFTRKDFIKKFLVVTWLEKEVPIILLTEVMIMP
jgi:hypothetical protein